MTDYVVKVVNLSKKYNIGSFHNSYSSISDSFYNFFKKKNKKESQTFFALEDVNFEIKKGETCGLIGKNGSGKSTLLKLISQIVTPTEGLIHLNGSLSSLLEVGTGFHPELTGRENVFLNASILGMKKKEIEQVMDSIIDFSGIGQFIDTQVKRYSSGMYIRLAFSIASHVNSDILILDEVLAVGDAFFQKSVLERINHISNSGKTILFVSHNLSQISNYCSTAIQLDKGRLVVKDEVSKVVKNYIESANNRSFDNGIVDLRNHSGRNKPQNFNRSLEFISITLSNNKIVTQKFSYEDDIEISLALQLNSLSAKNFQVEVRLHDQRGLVITCITSGVNEIRMNLKDFNVFLSISKLTLLPGNYSISIACKLNGFWSDSIFDCIGFVILENDEIVQYRNDDLAGIVYYKHKWKFYE